LKKYSITMLPLAKVDLSVIVDRLSNYSEIAALTYYDKLIMDIQELRYFPFKFKKIPLQKSSFDYRMIVSGEYSIIYIVLYETVEIHRII